MRRADRRNIFGLKLFFIFFQNIVHDIKNFVFLHRERYK